MRVLIASDLHWPTVNGIAVFGRNLARGLADAGHDVVVLAPSQSGKAHEESDGDVRVVRLRAGVFPFYQSLRYCVRPHRAIRRVVADFRPDVVHVQTPLGIGLAAVSIARKAGLPLVATNHSMSENFIDNITIARPVAKQVDAFLHTFGEWFYARADRVTVPTQAAIDMLKPEDFGPPTVAISNGIDLSAFHPGDAPADLRERFGIPKGVPLVIYVGRVDSEKHLSVLLEAANRIRETSAFHLVIVGSGVDLEHLTRLAGELGMLDRVTFTGRVEECDKRDLLHEASVFAISSPAELQSIATLEAAASGLPIVAVNAGALYELCEDGHNGYLFPLDDADAMGRAIAAVLDDPERARRMGEASREVASRHDLDETIRRYVGVYAQAVADHVEAREAAVSADGPATP